MSTKPTREEMTLAHVLGWSVELLRAANAVTNDTIALNTNLENINRPANVIQTKDSHRYQFIHHVYNNDYPKMFCIVKLQ